jgi:hypothetical protein
MNLPSPPHKYDRAHAQQVLEELRRSDQENFKSGRDVRLERGERLILRSPNGTRFKITVDNAGVISATAI